MSLVPSLLVSSLHRWRWGRLLDLAEAAEEMLAVKFWLCDRAFEVTVLAALQWLGQSLWRWPLARNACIRRWALYAPTTSGSCAVQGNTMYVVAGFELLISKC